VRSQRRSGRAEGEIRGKYTPAGQVYPGNQHTYWIYMHARFDPAIPAAPMVFQDGQTFWVEKSGPALDSRAGS
jgi:hypothetical protein